MGAVTIDLEHCDRSPGCPAMRSCPKGAIEPAPGGAYPGSNGYVVDEDACAGCAVCVRFCPGGAVRVRM